MLPFYFSLEINIKNLYNRLLTEHFAYLKTIPSSNVKVDCVYNSHTLDDRSLSMAKEILEYRHQAKLSKNMLNEFDPTYAVHLRWSDIVRSRQRN